VLNRINVTKYDVTFATKRVNPPTLRSYATEPNDQIITPFLHYLVETIPTIK